MLWRIALGAEWQWHLNPYLAHGTGAGRTALRVLAAMGDEQAAACIALLGMKGAV